VGLQKAKEVATTPTTLDDVKAQASFIVRTG